MHFLLILLRLGRYHISNELLPAIVACLHNSLTLHLSIIASRHPLGFAFACFTRSSINHKSSPNPHITSPPHVSNCHFCNPPLCASFVGAARLAIFTSAVFMYSCAKLAQTFL